eukprot:199860-Prorocentrum_minimum.AAC.7
MNSRSESTRQNTIQCYSVGVVEGLVLREYIIPLTGLAHNKYGLAALITSGRADGERCRRRGHASAKQVRLRSQFRSNRRNHVIIVDVIDVIDVVSAQHRVRHTS